jgi:hypothetical protein
MPAAGAGEAGQDRCRSAATWIAHERLFFRLRTTSFISRSETMLSMLTAPSEQNTFSSVHWLKAWFSIHLGMRSRDCPSTNSVGRASELHPLQKPTGVMRSGRITPGESASVYKSSPTGRKTGKCPCCRLIVQVKRTAFLGTNPEVWLLGCLPTARNRWKSPT